MLAAFCCTIIMLSFRLKGAQSMTDSVSLWAQDHCHPVKWRCCQSDPLQMVLYVCGSKSNGSFFCSWFQQFWQDPRHHWLNEAQNPTEIYRLLQTLTAVSVLTSSVHIDHYLNQKFQIWIYHSLRHVATYFQYSSCLIWCASASSLFLILKNCVLTATWVFATGS